MTVVREDRVITIGGERGMRGRDGVTSLLVSVEAETSGTYWTLTPDLPVVALGLDQIFFGIAPAAHSGSSLTVKVLGVNDAEERIVRLSDGTSAVSTSAVPPGASFAVRYNTVTGVFQLIWPAVTVPTAAPIVMLEQTDRTNNIVLFEPKAGYTLPNVTGYGVIMGAVLSGSGSGGWAFGIDGITLDPLVLRYPDDTTVEASRIADGAIAFWTRNETTGRYNLLEVWDADSVKAGSDTTTPYEARRAFYTARNIQIAAIG